MQCNILKNIVKEIIIKLLDQQYLDLYIGVTTILFTIIMFIFGIINEQKNELYKKVILYETKMEKFIEQIVFGFLIIIISNIFQYNNELSMLNIKNILYLIINISLIIQIIILIINIIKVFKNVIKLNIENDFLNQKLEEYIKIRVKGVQEKENNNNKNNIFNNGEVIFINDCLFKLAFEQDEDENYDKNKILYNYFKYLYDNKYYNIIECTLDNFIKVYRKIFYNFDKNQKYCEFLIKISNLAYNSKDYNTFEKINELILYLYLKQLENKDKDIKKITFDYINHILSWNLYSAKENEDIRYYDLFMGILLKFIIKNLKLNNYDAIEVIVDNISFREVPVYDCLKIDKYKIIKFQFICGIISTYLYLEKEKKINKENVNLMKKILGLFDHDFIFFSNIYLTINIFREYYNKKSYLQEYYKNLIFEFVDDKYKNSFMTYAIDEKEILKELIYICYIYIYDEKEVDIKLITKEDKNYYQNLLELVNSLNKSQLEELLEIKYNSSNLKKCLNYLINISEEKEKIYKQTSNLDFNKIKKFKQRIQENIYKNNKLINVLEKNKKIKKIDKLKNKVIGFNINIDREIFFKENEIENQFADKILESFNNIIEEEYIKKIEEISEISNNDLLYNFKKIDKNKNYIIITNYSGLRKLRECNYDFENQKIEFNNQKIDVLDLFFAKGIYIIEKNKLPCLNLCKYSKKYKKENIKENLYLEISDYPKQNNKYTIYCNLKAFLSFEIINPEIKIIKILI